MLYNGGEQILQGALIIPTVSSAYSYDLLAERSPDKAVLSSVHLEGASGS